MSKRFRNFSLITYLNEKDILKVLHKHNNQFKAYAYINHNLDTNKDNELKQQHYHILIALINNTTCEAIRNWFNGFEDSKGQLINTLAQPMFDVTSTYKYLTHNTEQAIEQGKHLYSIEDVKGYNLSFFEDTTKQDIDNLTLALTDMLEGIPLQEIMKKYGRDFIVHYGHIKMLFNDIQKQNGGTLI